MSFMSASHLFPIPVLKSLMQARDKITIVNKRSINSMSVCPFFEAKALEIGPSFLLCMFFENFIACFLINLYLKNIV